MDQTTQKSNTQQEMGLFLKQYKGKLQEALTLIPPMSQDEKTEAMVHWNNVGIQLSHIVHENEMIFSITENSNLTYRPPLGQPDTSRAPEYHTSIKLRSPSPDVPLQYNENSIIGSTDTKNIQITHYNNVMPENQTHYSESLAMQSLKSEIVTEHISPSSVPYATNPGSSNLINSKSHCQIVNQTEVDSYTMSQDLDFNSINQNDCSPSFTATIVGPSADTNYCPAIRVPARDPTLNKIETNATDQIDMITPINSSYGVSASALDPHVITYNSPSLNTSYDIDAQSIPMNQENDILQSHQVPIYNLPERVAPSMQQSNQNVRYYYDTNYVNNTDLAAPMGKPSHEISLGYLSIKQIKQENCDATQTKHTCPECPHKSFSTRGNLKRHMLSHTGERKYKCEFPGCDSRFTEKKSLKIHERRHTGDKPYVCEYCNKAFSQTGVLKSHKAIHENEKPYQCTKCDQFFRQKSQLKLHMDRHDNIKKLPCTYTDCSARFLTRGDLDRHIRTHTGERPYKCDLCEKQFTRMQGLNEHKNRHTGNRPFSCQCGKTFFEMSACYKHKKSCNE